MKLAYLWLALLAILATFETARALLAPARVAPASDWEAAAAEVRAGFSAGDLIVFAPAWADQVGRAHLGDLIPVEMAGRADADRYPRIWEVSIRGAHAPESSGASLLHEVRHGLVRVALYEKSAVAVSYDFTSHSREARVTESLGAQETPCYHDGQSGFRCAGVTVAPRTLEVDYRPHRGILAPVDGARTTQIEFTEVPLGATLVGYTGIHDYYSRKNSDGAVDFRVLLDGREREHVVARNADGWRRFTVDTSAENGTRHTVRFSISAADSSWRTFGFHAEVRR